MSSSAERNNSNLSDKLSHTKQTSKLKGVDIRKYTDQIWLAGLGAFSKAEEEGNKLFDSLVKMGQELEHKTTEVVDEVRDTVTDRLSNTANMTRERLEDVIHQTTSVLSGTSTKTTEQLVNVIETLHAKVDSLLKEVETLKKEK